VATGTYRAMGDYRHSKLYREMAGEILEGVAKHRGAGGKV
jgi:hypothetical protein